VHGLNSLRWRYIESIFENEDDAKAHAEKLRSETKDSDLHENGGTMSFHVIKHALIGEEQ